MLCSCPTCLFHNVTLLHASSCGTNLNDKQDHSAAGTLGSTYVRRQAGNILYSGSIIAALIYLW